jgi:hypothetical protein
MVKSAFHPVFTETALNKMLAFRLARSLRILIRRWWLISWYICSLVHRVIHMGSWKMRKRDTRRVIWIQRYLKPIFTHQIVIQEKA